MEYNNLSPLLNGAVEDLVHALEHVQTGSEKDNKYAVIHAATAVELVLKEKLRALGISIFEKKLPYHSLDYHDCVRVLHEKNIPLPLEADIELLHQERNSCTHLAGKPDNNKTRWLLNTAKQFMKDFCNTQLGFDINAYLPLEVGITVLDEAKRAHLNPAGIYLANAEMSMMDNNYAEVMLNAEMSIELLMKDYLESIGIGASPIFHDLIKQIEGKGKLPKYILETIDELRKLRNKITHLTITPSETDARKSINLARLVFEYLTKHWKEENRCIICGSKDVVDVEQSLKIDMSKIKNKKDLEKAVTKKGEIIGFYCKKHQPYWATH